MYNLEEEISQEVNLEGKVLEQEFACGRKTTHEGFIEQENGKDKNATYGEYRDDTPPLIKLDRRKKMEAKHPPSPLRSFFLHLITYTSRPQASWRTVLCARAFRWPFLLQRLFAQLSSPLRHCVTTGKQVHCPPVFSYATLRCCCCYVLRCGALVWFFHPFCLVGGGLPLICVEIGSRKGNFVSIHVG